MIRNIAGKTAKHNYFIIQGAELSFNQKDKEKCRNLWFYVIYGTMFPKAEAEFVQTFCRFLKYERGTYYRWRCGNGAGWHFGVRV